MERKPAQSTNIESSSEGSESTDIDKPSTKKKSIRRVPLQAPNVEKPIPENIEKPKKDLFEIAAGSEIESTEESAENDEIAEAATLSEEETQYVNQQIAAEHLSSLEVNGEADPRQDFLERVEAGADTETAFTEVATELGLSEEEIAEALQETEDSEPEFEAATEEPMEAEFNPENEEEGEIDLNPTPPATAAGGSSGSGGGTGSPPAPSGPSGPAMPHSAPGVPIAAPTPNFNAAPAATTVESVESRRSRAGQLLLVGAVGYLIGRRRGRIKTEKRLAPVQKQLEKRVMTLEQDMRTKENQLVVVKTRLQEKQPANAPTEQRRQPSRTESRLNLEKPVRTEHLAHMIVAAEAPKVIEKRVVERPNSIRRGFQAEEVRTMKRPELLELSEKITVEGASLRQIYETNLIGEKQLRHLISEYLQGKDIQKSLRREMVEHEIDFERDPIMRDRIHDELAKGSSGNSGLGDLLAKAGVNSSQSDSQLKRQIQKEAERRAEQERKQSQQRIITDVAMVTAVVILAVAVVILAFRG